MNDNDNGYMHLSFGSRIFGFHKSSSIPFYATSWSKYRNYNLISSEPSSMRAKSTLKSNHNTPNNYLFYIKEKVKKKKTIERKFSVGMPSNKKLSTFGRLNNFK